MKRILLLTYVTILMTSCAYTGVVQKSALNRDGSGSSPIQEIEINVGGTNFPVLVNTKKYLGSPRKGDNVKIITKWYWPFSKEKLIKKIENKTIKR